MVFTKTILFAALFSLLILSAPPVSAQASAADTLEAVLTRVSALLSEAKHDEAIALFDTIPLPERDSSQIKLLKASVLSSVGKYAEARTLAEAVAAAEPQNTEALFILAAVEGISGRTKQQREALEKIVKIDPNNSEALLSLGNICIQTRALQPAVSYFDRLLKNEPENPGGLIGLSRAYRMNREWENAELFLNRAVQLYPAMVEARTERARFYWGRGLLIQALEDMDQAKKIAPDDYWISIDRGNLLLEMNRRQQALEEFSLALIINPAEYRAYAYTAGLKDDFGDFEGAGRDYEILARLNPDYYFAFEGLGLHRMREERWLEARNAFMEAYRRAPDESFYALLAAANWMRAENPAAPRAFLAQVQAKITRDTLEWYMFRLYYDLTARNYLGETDMIVRLDRETDETLKARILFYMALYYDIRGNTALANKYFLQVSELDKRAIPEWRLNDWILADRGLKSF